MTELQLIKKELLDIYNGGNKIKLNAKEQNMARFIEGKLTKMLGGIGEDDLLVRLKSIAYNNCTYNNTIEKNIFLFENNNGHNSPSYNDEEIEKLNNLGIEYHDKYLLKYSFVEDKMEVEELSLVEYITFFINLHTSFINDLKKKKENKESNIRIKKNAMLIEKIIKIVAFYCFIIKKLKKIQNEDNEENDYTNNSGKNVLINYSIYNFYNLFIYLCRYIDTIYNNISALYKIIKGYERNNIQYHLYFNNAYDNYNSTFTAIYNNIISIILKYSNGSNTFLKINANTYEINYVKPPQNNIVVFNKLKIKNNKKYQLIYYIDNRYFSKSINIEDFNSKLIDINNISMRPYFYSYKYETKQSSYKLKYKYLSYNFNNDDT